MKYEHIMLDVPEVDYMEVQESVKDWQLGKRVAVEYVGLSLWDVFTVLPVGCSLVLLLPSLVLVGVGVFASVNANDWSILLRYAFYAATIIALILTLLYLVFVAGSGSRWWQMDWNREDFTWKTKTSLARIPFSKIEKLVIRVEREENLAGEHYALLDLHSDEKPRALFRTRSRTQSASEAAVVLANAGRRLAEAIGVPLSFEGTGKLSAEKVFAKARTDLQIAEKYRELGNRVRGLMSLCEYKGLHDEAELHRAEASHHYMQALKLNPADAQAILHLGELSDDPTIRETAMEAAQKANPHSQAPLLEKARQLFFSDQFQEAIDLYTQLLRDEPSVDAYEGRSGVYEYLERYEDAVADLTKVIELDPSEFNYTHRGDVLFAWAKEAERDDLLPKALADYEQAIEASPDDEPYQTTRCQILSKMGHTDQALGGLDQVIHDYPNEFHPYTVRGEIHLEQHSVDAAIDDFTVAIGLLKKENPGGDSDAKDYFDTALAYAYKFRAEAYRLNNRNSDADADERRFQELYGQR
ncbi:hypothetical protein C5Y96_07575 [Blastopirellula marina]|uniref:Uncharacterized protein n=1 Tax=Blastopirellula marina TaxID=124 RepID=A0A2S8FY67_9BACT|nr:MULTISPECIES: tetratricopeptide repeat protein [Pirellulaceae]PQO37010.1 hypothetical protein C5Y96_07575 [Blastopirellula marina]RCS53725.1 tetratricopeptide repeat protein [Bremerella cremea]